MKAIESEYKNQISLEIPDLWSRIEAGVDEYEMNKAKSAEAKQQNEPVVLNNIIDNTAVDAARIKKSNNKKIVSMFSKIVVAAASLIVVSTIILTVGVRKNDSATQMNFAADSVAKDDFSYAEESACEATVEDEPGIMESAGAADYEEEAVCEEVPENTKSDSGDLGPEIGCDAESVEQLLKIFDEKGITGLSFVQKLETESEDMVIFELVDEQGMFYLVEGTLIDNKLDIEIITDESPEAEIIYSK